TALIIMDVTPANAPPSTGIMVFVNLSAVGGPAIQYLFDDGTHGDALPGDNKYACLFAMPSSVAVGTYPISYNVTDGQLRTATGTFPFIVGPPRCPPSGGTATSAAYTVTGAPTNTPWSWRIASPTSVFAD